MPTNNNYKRGANLERAVKKYYTDLGYQCTRAAGSHGSYDLWATDLKDLIWVQCKIGANENRCKTILKEMISENTILHNTATIPVAYSVVVGMKGGKPVVLAEQYVKPKNKVTKKSGISVSPF